MTLLPITILIGIGSFIFTAIVLVRLYRYVHKFPLPESKYTLLAGFIRLNHIAFLYVFSVVLLFVISVSFVLSLNL